MPFDNEQFDKKRMEMLNVFFFLQRKEELVTENDEL